MTNKYLISRGHSSFSSDITEEFYFDLKRNDHYFLSLQHEGEFNSVPSS